MNEDSLSLPTQGDENKIIHFWPVERCAYCPRLTCVALLDLARAQWFVPVCPLHGFVLAYRSMPTAREQADARASVERFVVWMHAEQGRVPLITALEPEQVPDYPFTVDPFTIEPLAWHCRYEAPDGERSDAYVIWDMDGNEFSLYEQGALVRERREQVA